MAKRKLRFEKLCESITTEKMAEILQKTNEDDCKSSDDELLSPDSLPHHSFSLFSPNCFSIPRSSNFHLSPLSSCLSNPNNTDDIPPENNLVHDESFIAEALKTEPPSSLSLPLLPVPNNQSSSSNNSASFGGSALENESLLSNTSLSFHAPALENDSLFSSVIGVARIFDWGGPKPQITRNDVIRNFRKRNFLWGKDIVEWKI